MTGPRVVAIGALIAVLAVGWMVFGPMPPPPTGGCTTPEEQPVAAEPAAQAQIHIAWAGGEVPAQVRDADEELMLDVAAFNDAFVAVGRESNGPASRAFALRSTDGRDWEAIPAADGWLDMEIRALEVVGDRLFGIGSASTDDRGGSRGVVMYTDDGLTWHEAAGELSDGSPYALAGDASGLVLLGAANADGTLLFWQSSDGEDWQPLAVELPVDQRFAQFGDLERTEAGWLAVGSLSAGVDRPAAPVAWRSSDSRAWTCHLLDSAGYEVVHPFALHRSGSRWLASGGASSVCGAMASCPGWSIAWQSADGVTWGSAIGDEPISIGGLAYGGGPDAFLAVGQGNTWQSRDGSSWTMAEIGESGHVLQGQADAVAVSADGRRVVAVGTQWIGPADTNPWIAVGEVGGG